MSTVLQIAVETTFLSLVLLLLLLEYHILFSLHMHGISTFQMTSLMSQFLFVRIHSLYFIYFIVSSSQR